MNITEAFANYMITKGYGTALNTDVFIGVIPLNAPDKVWRLLSGGGNATQKNVTGEKLKNYIIQVSYRSDDAEELYNTLEAFEVEMNTQNCDEIEGYDTVEIEATSFPADQDIEEEDRTIGQAQISLTTHL